MTDTIFNLQVKLVADDDRGRKQDKRLIEELVGEALKQVIPEAFRLNLMNKDDPENHTKYVNALTDYWKVMRKDEQFIEHELDKLRDQGIKF